MENQENNSKPEFVAQNKKVFPRNKFNKHFHNFNNPKPKSQGVKITFLGGLGEIGKNMTVFETAEDIIVLDSGLSFADETTPGVELIVPDISYLRDKKNKIRAFIITHGHEDHIGALPFVLNEIKAPVYASRFTLSLIENKMHEHPKVKYQAFEVKPRQNLKFGAFNIEFLHVNHSIPGAMGLAINTPWGTILHTGDFKIDNTPINQATTDLARIEQLGKQGIKLLMCESTNVGVDGWSRSESTVQTNLEENIFKKHANQRLIIATFASNVARLQEILGLAEKYKRKVAFTGRSMINVSQVAMKLGEMHYDKENIIDLESIKKYADNEICIITTGSQGEALSALTRMANDNFAKFKLSTNDCVAFSSSPIPGNEKAIINTINKLVHKGITVETNEFAQIHASGHACQQEIKKILELAKPEFILPVHGEYLHLAEYKKFAIESGFNERQILICDLGQQVIMSPTTVRKAGFIKAGARLVDGNALGDLTSPVISDRITLSQSGFVIVVLNISAKQARLLSEPIIITRGLLYNNEYESVLKELKTAISVHIKTYDLKNIDANEMKTGLKKFISTVIAKKTRRKPVVLCTTIIN